MPQQNDDPRHLVGRRIRQARERKNLTQHQLAAKVGVSYQLIQQYERGQKLSLDRIIRLAQALGIKASSMFQLQLALTLALT